MIEPKKHILITTGIYPPKIGGPSQYAMNLKIEFEKQGNKVEVRTFSLEDYLPSGLRHMFFFFKIIPQVIKSDTVFIMDTLSVGLPTVLACRLLGKKSIIRTGGDFIWEQYVERTGKMIFLGDFYEQEQENFSLKEQIIFRLTKWTLINTSGIIFSTEWQRDIFIKAYGFEREKTFIVENYYGPKDLSAIPAPAGQTGKSFEPRTKLFIASTRKLKWKQTETLKKIFNKIKEQHNEVDLFTEVLPFPDLMNKIKNSYAVILISIGDISPNMILDSIRYNKPFICTREVGIFQKIKDAGIFVDPLNELEIEKAVLDLINNDGYDKAVERVRQFSFIHTWDEIAEEFINIYKSI